MSSKSATRAPIIRALTSALIAAALVGAACGGGKGESSGLSAEQEELRALAAGLDDTTGKVVYDLFSTFGGKPEGEWTVYRRPNSFRMTFVGTKENLTYSTTTIIDGSEATICNTGNEHGACSSVTVEKAEAEREALVAAFALPAAMAEQIEKFEITGVRQRTIAGESAKCFSAESQEFLSFFQTGEVCFSEDGLLLSLDSIVSRPLYTREFSLEALEVSRDVSDSDFEPLFPVPTPPPAARTPSPGP